MLRNLTFLICLSASASLFRVMHHEDFQINSTKWINNTSQYNFKLIIQVTNTKTDALFFMSTIIFKIFHFEHLNQSTIISNNHGIYKLPHELPNNLFLRSYEIRKYQENLKISQNYTLVPSIPAKIKILLNLAKNSWKLEIKLFPYCASISHEK